MAYSDFTFKQLRTAFGIENRIKSVFEHEIIPVEISVSLKKAVSTAELLPMRTEKAKSELLVLPILLDIWERNEHFFTIYSGENLNADKANGLTGECDFILAKDVNTYEISLPIISIVEAKRDNIEQGVAQCASQLLGARIFNEESNPVQILYGCVTNSREWQFLRLIDNQVEVHPELFYITEVEKILGAFQQIIDYYKLVLK
ncbi:MAG: hypothetical protein U5M51_13505 [Emticicia sp.]|nr:hypothetical protein [Emticicia sp.]